MARAIDEDSAWHLDKRVPIALITTLAIQTCGIVWWAASMQARVERLEISADRTEGQGGQIIRLEARLGYIAATLERIERSLSDRSRQNGMSGMQ